MLVGGYSKLYATGPHTSKGYQKSLDLRIAGVRSRYRFVEQCRTTGRPVARAATRMTLAI